MFYLFSSDAETRYKRNVLDILCYPEGQIFRFRYNISHVAPTIQTLASDPESDSKLNKKEWGRKAVAVYAETTGKVPTRSFTFYPTREVEILRIQVIGTVYYVDVKLGRFIDYTSCSCAPDCLTSFRDTFSQLEFYPLPALTQKLGAEGDQPEDREGLTWALNEKNPRPYTGTSAITNQGYFFHHVTDNSTAALKYNTGLSDNHKAWQSAIEILSSAPSMRNSVFYLVEGFYLVRREYLLFGKQREHLIPPKNNGWETRYPLKMGKTVVLKLLFYRSEKASSISSRSLEIRTEGDAFAGFSQKEIPLLSRYNEERILIACKRVFDSIFAPIVIALKKESDSVPVSADSLFLLRSTQVATPWGVLEFKLKEPQEDTAATNASADILAPNPFLLTQVVPSQGLILLTLVFLTFASFFLFMSPDYIQMLGWSRLIQQNSKEFGDWLVRNAPTLSQLSKIFGAVLTLAAGYLGFRKLPLGK
jgi:hypothetical protein